MQVVVIVVGIAELGLFKSFGVDTFIEGFSVSFVACCCCVYACSCIVVACPPSITLGSPLLGDNSSIVRRRGHSPAHNSMLMMALPKPYWVVVLPPLPVQHQAHSPSSSGLYHHSSCCYCRSHSTRMCSVGRLRLV
jgi:hypothetical protein